jgi:protein OS-9
MKLGSKDAYLCLTPPAPEYQPIPPLEEATQVTALHSWSLLQPLAGSCIYVCDTQAILDNRCQY